MGLRVLLGRAGTGKSERCNAEIRAQLEADPIGAPLLYLVPEQMTFQVEKELAQTTGLHGMMRAQVFSFRRLAWKVLQEVGGIARPHISSLGVQMVLRQVLEKEHEQLRLFGRAASQMGFTDQLEQLYIELKRYRIDGETLQRQVETISAKAMEGPEYSLLADKLHDLQLLYHQVEQQLEGQYLDTEDYLRLLAEKIPHSHYIREATVWIDGFHGFTPQEFAIVFALITYAKDVTLTLTLDRPYEESEGQWDQFYPTGTTYTILKEYVQQNGWAYTETLLDPTTYRFHSPELAYVEQQLDNIAVEGYATAPTAVRIYQAVHRRAEIEGIAREVLRLVRDEGYRWREIAILVRDMATYEALLTTIFSVEQIPIYLDQRRTMLHHPLVELLRSVIEIAIHGWPTDAVLRCLKTALLVPQYEDLEIDRFENYVLAYGIQHGRWTEKADWQLYERSGQKRIPEEKLATEIAHLNDIRRAIVAPLRELEHGLRAAKTVRDSCTAITQFLLDLHVPEQLEMWAEKAQHDGLLERAREHGQAWQAVCELLDQMVEVMGEERYSLELFSKIFTSGLEGLQFSLIPPALDQVLIGTAERTRARGIRAAFILGVNDGVYPLRPAEDGILFESERELLLQFGLELAPSSERRLREEDFLLYSMLTMASHRLYLSYALADEEGRALVPAALVSQMKQLFPQIRETLLLLEPIVGEEMVFVTRPRHTLSQLAIQLRMWKKGYRIDPLWFAVYNWFVDESRESALHTTARHVLRGLYYTNQEKALRADTRRALYSSHLKASVSRLEKFQSCPFAHFASYGLRLEERAVFRLEAPNIGSLFHDALDWMSAHLLQANKRWRDLNKHEVDHLATTAVQQLAPHFQKQILFSSKRLQYIGNKLQRVVARAGNVLSLHDRRSHFAPIGTEIYFAASGEIPSLSFTLANGYTLELVGRIDRVDSATSSSGLLLRVIDYKSSSRSLNLVEVYYGLALQMLTYLDVIVSNAQSWLGAPAAPAGMLYFHVHNALLSAKGPLTQQEMEKKLLSSYKMRGLLLADVESARLMDQELATGHSEIVPVGIKRDGGFYSTSSVITPFAMKQLRTHVRNTIVTIGTQITDGDVAIRPYLLNKKTPCTYCEYKPICQFDTLYDGNMYHKLPTLDKAQVLERLAREEEKHDGHDDKTAKHASLDNGAAKGD